jgi:pimeloyl-ACP methyl ester carboxylesterase
MQSAAWGPQINYLAQTHRVIALDMPGHGGSSALPYGAELTDFVAWAADAITALGLGRVSLAGHSMGALVAGGLAATRPDLVARVALINGVYRRSVEARAAVEARASQIKDGQIDMETPLNRWFGNTPSEVAARELVAGWLRSVDPKGYAVAYGAFARGDATYADRIKDITCPLLALTGDGDANSTPAMAQAMAHAAHHGHCVVIKGHRHMVNLTAPETVNAALDAWLATPTQEDPR